ncbi:MAG: hypothetical protein GY928_35525 [Colwellia sp.]|nr:hypothetical protein [Colwellia sp.]
MNTTTINQPIQKPFTQTISEAYLVQKVLEALQNWKQQPLPEKAINLSITSVATLFILTFYINYITLQEVAVILKITSYGRAWVWALIPDLFMTSLIFSDLALSLNGKKSNYAYYGKWMAVAFSTMFCSVHADWSFVYPLGEALSNTWTNTGTNAMAFLQLLAYTMPVPVLTVATNVIVKAIKSKRKFANHLESDNGNQSPKTPPQPITKPIPQLLRIPSLATPIASPPAIPANGNGHALKVGTPKHGQANPVQNPPPPKVESAKNGMDSDVRIPPTAKKK